MMDDNINKNTEQLLDTLLQKTARSFYISVKILPEKMRISVTIGYLLARITDTLADEIDLPANVRDDMINEVVKMINNGVSAGQTKQLQPAIEALAKNSNLHMVLLHVSDVISACDTLNQKTHQDLVQCLNIITSAQRSEIEWFKDKNKMGFIDRGEELDNYIYSVAGSVGECWTHISFDSYPVLSSLAADQLFAYSIDFGKGLQLLNILRDIPHDLQNNRCYIPLDFLQRADINTDNLSQHPERLEPVVEQLQQRVIVYLQHGWLYMTSLKPMRLRFASAVTVLFAFATLDKLRDKKYLNQQAPTKISRLQIRYLMLIAVVGVISTRLFTFLLRLTPYQKYLP